MPALLPSISAHAEQYDLELDRVISMIKKENARVVAIQLPDGLKPHAEQIVKAIEANTRATPVIWAGSCWGSCDIPDVEKIGADLLIQWGHSEWSY